MRACRAGNHVRGDAPFDRGQALMKRTSKPLPGTASAASPRTRGRAIPHELQLLTAGGAGTVDEGSTTGLTEASSR